MEIVPAAEATEAVPFNVACGTSSAEERPTPVRESVDCPNVIVFSSRVFEVQLVPLSVVQVTCIGEAGKGSDEERRVERGLLTVSSSREARPIGCGID